MKTELERLVSRYRELRIESQIDYGKFYLYSIITHSTAIEGSTITEIENQIMFDQGVSLKGKSLEEQNMNLDLKSAYEKSLQLAKAHEPVTVDMLKELSALVMKNTGKEYRTALGDFSSARGELRLLNVTAGVGGKSYMSYNKVPARLSELCAWLNEERAGHSAVRRPVQRGPASRKGSENGNKRLYWEGAVLPRRYRLPKPADQASVPRVQVDPVVLSWFCF